mgnify:FL=1
MLLRPESIFFDNQTENVSFCCYFGNEKEIGKPLHSDEKNNKKTYITINGIEKSEHDIVVMSEEACDIISSLGNDVEERDFIIKLIKYLTDRTY